MLVASYTDYELVVYSSKKRYVYSCNPWQRRKVLRQRTEGRQWQMLRKMGLLQSSSQSTPNQGS